MKRFGGLGLILLAVTLGCGRSGQPGGSSEGRLEGAVRIDGSSTVFPIVEALAEEFQKVEPEVRVTVGIAGTGGGFKRFTAGETDINNASRPIDPSESETAAQHGIGFIEIPIAFDGLSVVVHPSNDFVSALTVEELRRIWQPESTVRRWSDVRPAWPGREIHFYGPGHDSGTFDYFTEAIVGKVKAMRSDYNASEDDNVLVQGISGDRDALGFFGFAYYFENKDRIKLVAVDGGQGPVLPSHETISNGTYHPLSRPLFLYVSAKSADRPEVQAFVRFALGHVMTLAEQVGYVALPPRVYELAGQRWEQRRLGSVYTGKTHEAGTSLEALLEAGQ